VIRLAIDTASDRLSLAARAPGRPTSERSVDGVRRHAAALGPEVVAVLADLGATIADLDAVVVSDGPGSFTGLRVSTAFAKAVARARAIPLWAASTLMARAWTAAVRGPDVARPLVVAGVGSALRGELYVAVYRISRGRSEHIEGEGRGAVPSDAVETILAPTVVAAGASLPIDQAIDRVVGDVAPAGLGRWSWTGGAELIGPPDGLPRAVALLDLVGALGGAEPVRDVGAWEPFYGRPAEAQARWEQRHGRPLVDPVRVR
jgi:tRNA threonylcarbamoyl adenosine modification protein YeaZ